MTNDFKNPWGEGSAEYNKWQPGHDASNQYLKWLPQGDAFFDESQDEKQAKWDNFWGKNKSTESNAIEREAIDEYNGEETDGYFLGGDNEDYSTVSCLPFGGVGKNPDSLPTNSVVIPYELEFIGKITSINVIGYCKSDENKDFETQQATGKLTIYRKLSNGSREVVISVDAISGDGGMGCIPNTEYAPGKDVKYYVGRLEAPYIGFHDGEIRKNPATGKYEAEKEHAYRMFIYDPFVSRGEFRIHPTIVGANYNSALQKIEPQLGLNDGCISPWKEDSVAFYKEAAKIFTKPNLVAPLTVKIAGNLNHTLYIYRKSQTPHYDPKYVSGQ